MIYKNLFMSFKPKFFDVITTNVFAIQELIVGHYIAATYVATRPCMISTLFLLICNITLFFKYFTYESSYIPFHLIILYKLVTVFILPTIFFLYAKLIFSMDWGNFHATKLYMEGKSHVELLDFNQLG